VSFSPQCGEIVFVLAPSVGYRKYHICLGPNEHGSFLFLFLNSDDGFIGDCTFTCADFPAVPVSTTGLSVVSFSMVPRFTQAQLDLHGAQSFGPISKAVAATLVQHLAPIKTLTKPEKAFVTAALTSLC
jgi:hypothetical protein